MVIHQGTKYTNIHKHKIYQAARTSNELLTLLRQNFDYSVLKFTRSSFELAPDPQNLNDIAAGTQDLVISLQFLVHNAPAEVGNKTLSIHSCTPTLRFPAEYFNAQLQILKLYYRV